MAKPLTLQTLKKMVDEGTIDTVVVAFSDHLGRLIGKRVTADYFFHYTVRHGMHACDYLLTVDMEMNPLAGFQMASWDKGYGDFHGILDPHTLRITPWLEGTALGLVDLEWENGGPVEPAPRSILKKQLARAEKAGMHIFTASELEFYLFQERHEDLVERNFNAPAPLSQYLIDYHILQTSRD